MRVLVLTIEEDPPSLRSYENDKQSNGAPFSRLFEEFYKKCLLKNPKYEIYFILSITSVYCSSDILLLYLSRIRSSAEELLKLKFFKNRDASALVSQYLDKIPSVRTKYVHS